MLNNTLIVDYKGFRELKWLKFKDFIRTLDCLIIVNKKKNNFRYVKCPIRFMPMKKYHLKMLPFHLEYLNEQQRQFDIILDLWKKKQG